MRGSLGTRQGNNQDALFSISKDGVLTFRESPDYVDV